MKVLKRLTEQLIRGKVTINNMQFGFMSGKGTTDVIFIVRQLHEKLLQQISPCI
jgi:hypothetical protein